MRRLSLTLLLLCLLASPARAQTTAGVGDTPLLDLIEIDVLGHDLVAFRAGGGINFRGSQTPNRNPGWDAESWVTGDLMAEYTVNKSFTVKANLTNVSNKLYADQLYSGHYIPGAGRMLQVTGSVKF